MSNPTIEILRSRRSVRRYKPDQPSDEVIETIVRAGQQAPFTSQLYSVLLSRKKKIRYGAPLLFTICADLHKLERFMSLRGWKAVTSDLSLFLFAVQDAAYMAQNMVIAAESLGLGSCFLGSALFRSREIAAAYQLPQRVFPVVQLVMGYPDESCPPRPRYPLSFTLFEDRYPELTDEQVSEAMREMDEGYLRQDYYRKQNIKIDLADEREDPFTHDNYSWTEHISRKWGQWFPSPQELIDQLKERGINLMEEK
jgi:nitroreductase